MGQMEVVGIRVESPAAQPVLLLREVFDRSRVQLVQVPRRILELRAERARVGRDPGTIAGENAVVRGSDDPAELVATGSAPPIGNTQAASTPLARWSRWATDDCST